MPYNKPWSAIETSYGTAIHFPQALNKLLSSNELVRSEGYWEIDNYAVVQGTLYEAAYYVIEPIVEILEKPYTVDRTLPLNLLIQIVLGYGGEDLVYFSDIDICLTIEQACKNKLVALKDRIYSIEVITEAEKEDKSVLIEEIESINQ